ncbi:bacteriohemerythrin [bacterium]|nr:bacteriohemerythrin [bacterium]
MDLEKKVIVWTEELSTGIEWQDFQHKEFLELTNSVFDSFYENKGKIDFEKTIDELERYAKQHFSIEDRYMALFEFPGTKDHQKQHEEFWAFIEDIKIASKRNILEAGRICNKLNNWFVDHIKVVDKKLGRFLQVKSQR